MIMPDTLTIAMRSDVDRSSFSTIDDLIPRGEEPIVKVIGPHAVTQNIATAIIMIRQNMGSLLVCEHHNLNQFSSDAK
jgi:hypothetical protein